MTVVLQGFKGLEGLLIDMGKAAADGDYTSTLLDIQSDLEEQERQMFQGEHAADGEPWAPLRPTTVAAKGHSRILYDLGELWASLTEAAAEGAIRELDSEGLTFGTDHRAARYHQDGTSRMPARPPVGLSEETADKAADRIAQRTLELSLEEVRA